MCLVCQHLKEEGECSEGYIPQKQVGREHGGFLGAGGGYEGAPGEGCPDEAKPSQTKPSQAKPMLACFAVVNRMKKKPVTFPKPHHNLAP